MEELDCAVDNLIGAIRKTKEYQVYQRERSRVDRFPDLKAQIDEYRNQNYMLQSMTDDDELFQKIEEFERRYEKFREDPLVSDFLAAELDFCRMMQQVFGRVTSALDFD